MSTAHKFKVLSLLFVSKVGISKYQLTNEIGDKDLKYVIVEHRKLQNMVMGSFTLFAIPWPVKPGKREDPDDDPKLRALGSSVPNELYFRFVDMLYQMETFDDIKDSLVSDDDKSALVQFTICMPESSDLAIKALGWWSTNCNTNKKQWLQKFLKSACNALNLPVVRHILLELEPEPESEPESDDEPEPESDDESEESGNEMSPFWYVGNISAESFWYIGSESTNPDVEEDPNELAIYKLLLDNKLVYPNKGRYTDGKTPIMYAAEIGKWKLLEMMLEKVSPESVHKSIILVLPNIDTRAVYTAMDFAIIQLNHNKDTNGRFAKCLKLLVKYGGLPKDMEESLRGNTMVLSVVQ